MNQAMKAVVAHGRNQYTLETRPVPALRDGEMLVISIRKGSAERTLRIRGGSGAGA